MQGLILFLILAFALPAQASSLAPAEDLVISNGEDVWTLEVSAKNATLCDDLDCIRIDEIRDSIPLHDLFSSPATWHGIWALPDGSAVVDSQKPGGMNGYLGSIFVTISGIPIRIWQHNEYVSRDPHTEVFAGSPMFFTAIHDLRVPTTASAWLGYVVLVNSGWMTDPGAYIASSPARGGEQKLEADNVGPGGRIASPFGPIALFEPQTIYYRVTQPNVEAYIVTTGWVY